MLAVVRPTYERSSAASIDTIIVLIHCTIYHTAVELTDVDKFAHIYQNLQSFLTVNTRTYEYM